jgi:hypothetical protein
MAAISCHSVAPHDLPQNGHGAGIVDSICYI